MKLVPITAIPRAAKRFGDPLPISGGRIAQQYRMEIGEQERVFEAVDGKFFELVADDD